MGDSDANDYLKAVTAWKMRELDVLAETKVFTLRRRHSTSTLKPSRSGEFVYLDAPDWVNVIALTEDDQVVLIEQFRHALGSVTLEIPGGVVEDDEDPHTAGLRELEEETGYGGGRAEMIGVVTPNPAILNNRCHTLLVRGAVERRRPALDGMEEISVRLSPLTEIPDLIRRGTIDHALVVAAFHHLSLL